MAFSTVFLVFLDMTKNTVFYVPKPAGKTYFTAHLAKITVFTEDTGESLFLLKITVFCCLFDTNGRF